jgi:hypothetical protein
VNYKYHCQHQAESFSKAILTVPNDYPLLEGLDHDFRQNFSILCELAKSIYLDMAESPESYGLMLVDYASKDHNLARDGYRTIHRFLDTLSALCAIGVLENHSLKVSVESFAKEIKKGRGAVSGPVPKYELILSKLMCFGFVFSDFEGKAFNKKLDYFTVEFPDDPVIIDTIKTYCDCWDTLKTDRKTIKTWPNAFHHHYYRFDYKITANHEKITMTKWLEDEADYYGYSPELKTIALKFYDCSLKYKGIKFDGDYHYRSKRIARIEQTGWDALNETTYKLSIKLTQPDKYMNVIDSLPESIQKPFRKNYCRHCNFQGATKTNCKFRIHWTFENKAHEGCTYRCFYFDEFDGAQAEHFWQLLESEYGLVSGGKQHD